ncbi:Uncharacterised protein [Chromobacterium violaceum]|uniref:Uncharacterized protein n=1 Tax=Chromobacterium violaceum TaxID=536 RepID=A0A447TFE7_CHRVL|nr:Uncharacterised protein [Chromobacterium violaceum]
MDAVSQVSAQNVSGGTQVFALKKAMQADAQSTLTLLQARSSPPSRSRLPIRPTWTESGRARLSGAAARRLRVLK